MQGKFLLSIIPRVSEELASVGGKGSEELSLGSGEVISDHTQAS